jgi:hypothetical protein
MGRVALVRAAPPLLPHARSISIDSTGIVTIIAALSLGAVQVITAWRTAVRVDQARIELAAKTDTTARVLAAKTEDVAAGLASKAEEVAQEATGKLDQIHTLTNSNLTSLKAQLAEANVKIEKLEKLVSDLAASRVGSPPPLPLPEVKG